VTATAIAEPPALPVVCDTDAVDNQQLVVEHPDRQYRLRPGWAVRRRGHNTFLRTPITGSHEDSERLAEPLWWQSAPDLSRRTRDALTKAAHCSGSKPRSPANARGPPRGRLH
jgi:hypothetical protein